MMRQQINRAFYKTLPKKRMGAGILLCDTHDRVLLVKPTYKSTWEIPGGIVEHNESPYACCIREVKEELNIECPPIRLLCVDYNPDTGQKTESLMFVFDGGILSASQIANIQLPSQELSTYRFVSWEEPLPPLAPALENRIRYCWQQRKNAGSVYLEDQQPIF